MGWLKPAASLAVFAVAAALSPGCQPSPAGRASSVRGASARLFNEEKLAREAFRLVNRERRYRGMPDLVRRPDLDAVAARHARDQARMGRLSHVGSDGGRLENRLASLEWIWAGENLARNKGFDSPPEEAIRGWIASPRHYENMFRPDFSHTGMASILDPATGFAYFVQVFIIPTA
ncbi:MAG: CAP domain-containing protein [Planctomycetota bacterium]|jgi:uncharacterized protein YkwD|nr:CAP domain-containing protein [Planctomycetota bacterium]